MTSLQLPRRQNWVAIQEKVGRIHLYRRSSLIRTICLFGGAPFKCLIYCTQHRGRIQCTAKITTKRKKTKIRWNLLRARYQTFPTQAHHCLEKAARQFHKLCCTVLYCILLSLNKLYFCILYAFKIPLL